MSNLNIYIPYADHARMTEDSAKLKAITSILTTEFPDDTCQLIAIKSVLGLPITEEEPSADPSDPDTSGDPTP